MSRDLLDVSVVGRACRVTYWLTFAGLGALALATFLRAWPERSKITLGAGALLVVTALVLASRPVLPGDDDMKRLFFFIPFAGAVTLLLLRFARFVSTGNGKAGKIGKIDKIGKIGDEREPSE